MRRATRIATALAAGVVLSVALSGCSVIGNLISGATEDDVFTLAIGDCFDDNTATESGEDIESVPTVDCAKPHDYEVYSSLIMDEEEYPGDAATQEIADAQCLATFDGFLGATYDEAIANDYTYFYPSTQSWGLGDREILCMIVAIDENGKIVKVTDSLKGAGV